MKPLTIPMLKDTLIHFRILSLLNIALSVTKLDAVCISKEKKQAIMANPNLSYLAVDGRYQSQGIGKYFLMKSIDIMKEFYPNKQFISVETDDPLTQNFYTNKCSFMPYAKRFRFFRSLAIYTMPLNDKTSE